MSALEGHPSGLNATDNTSDLFSGLDIPPPISCSAHSHAQATLEFIKQTADLPCAEVIFRQIELIELLPRFLQNCEHRCGVGTAGQHIFGIPKKTSAHCLGIFGCAARSTHLQCT